MFKLKVVAIGVYQIHSWNGNAYEGTLEAIMEKSVAMGVRRDEFIAAVKYMNEQGHDYAEFGVMGFFTVSGVTRKAA